MATGGWDCPFCTFINKQSSFKCDICKASRGTSTRQARMQPQVLEMHQSTEISSTAKTPTQNPSSSIEKDLVSSASSSRSSSPLPQWSQNSLSTSLPGKITKQKTKKGKSRGRPPKHHSSWPRVPKLDYQTGISLDVEYKRVIATVTEYQLRE